jgi:poly(beta-D-mannuronate) lyase
MLMKTIFNDFWKGVYGKSIAIIFVAFFVLAVLLVISKNKKEIPILEYLSSQKPSLQIPQESYYPSKVISFSNWKLTLPVSSSSNSSSPLSISQPQLETFEMVPWFQATSDKQGIIFRAPVNAPTTNNSNYPRSELREMTDGGADEAFWSSMSGTHTLFLDQAITAVPKNKPEVVAGQIHGDDDDLIVIRLEGDKLFVARSKKNLVTLDESYFLGKRFTVKFVVQDGKIAVYYNGGAEPVYILPKKVEQAYFKAGVYTQSNCETEGSPDLCSVDNYGEVIIYKADVSHSS